VPHDRLKGTVFGSASEPIIDRFPVAIPFWHILPGCPRTQDPEDAIDDPPVIVVRTTAAFDLWKKRFDTFVLLISEPKATASSGVEA
jgi:hypothetical protein